MSGSMSNMSFVDPYGYYLPQDGIKQSIQAASSSEAMTKKEALEFINILLNDGLCRATRDRYNDLMDKYKKETGNGG